MSGEEGYATGRATMVQSGWDLVDPMRPGVYASRTALMKTESLDINVEFEKIMSSVNSELYQQGSQSYQYESESWADEPAQIGTENSWLSAGDETG